MPSTEELLRLEQQVLFPNYARQPLVIDRGEGCYLWDKEGRRYLDLVAGIAVCSVGHCHPRLVEAISDQAGRLLHVSNGFHIENQTLLARALTERSFADRAVFCNSGAEAIETALKLARKYHYEKGDKGRFRFINFHNAFHGRTMGALSATPRPKYQEGFQPLVPGFDTAPFGDLDAVRKLTGPETAAILVEPIQGEGGVFPAPPGFLAGLREIAKASGALLIYDEIQCGFGRTGKWWSHQHDNVEPDIMALAKGLGGGTPIGAVLAREEIAQVLKPGTHASTFAGGPLVCAAALAAIDIIESQDLLANAAETGAYLQARLQDLAPSLSGLIKDVRGRGLMLALQMTREAPKLRDDARAAGLIINQTSPDTIRFVPPLTLTPREADEAIDLLFPLLKQLAG
ncbi:MAG: Acetylornithine aminotransferase [Myxococcota bacterium]|nr:Acetylornithine aminotransferase [Myxococcota bacterium]